MTNFVTDGTSLFTAKADLVALPGGADATKYLSAADVELMRQALLDIQTYLRTRLNVAIAQAALSGGAGVTNNDYNFGSLGWITFIPLTAGFLEQLAGITNGGTVMGAGDDGKILCLWNAGANTLALINEGGASTAANRFTCLGGGNNSLTVKSAAWFRYRAASARWEMTGITN